MASLRGSLVLCTFFAAPVVAFAQVFNISTGVNITGSAPNVTDTVWNLVAAPAALGTLPENPWVFPNSDFPVSTHWVPNTTTSSWISAKQPVVGDSDTAPDGRYVFEFRFTLTTAVTDLSSITFKVASDNPLLDEHGASGIQGAKLNNTFLDVSTPSGQNGEPQPFANLYGPSFSTVNSFSFLNTGGTLFTLGENVLQFFVNNNVQAAGNPVGLRVEGSVNAIAIPEPGTYAALLGLASIGVVTLRRLRRRVG